MFLDNRRWRFVVIVGLLFVSAAVGVFILSNRRPPSLRHFSRIRDDWERTVYGHALAGGPLTALRDWRRKPLTEPEKQQRIPLLASRCLAHADKYPNTTGELAALHLAACRAPDTEAGLQARDRLMLRVATADMAQLQQAIRISRAGKTLAIVPAILDRVKKSPDHPQAPAMLAYVCGAVVDKSDTHDAPPHFTEAAELFLAHWAESSEIHSLCEILGNGLGGPPWASQFEPHLRVILDKNHDRWVRCTASMALASIAQASPARQQEAEELYKKLLAEFDGKTDYSGQYVEQEYRRRAEFQLVALRFTAVGRPAPEISGIDLAGQPMTLSEYRGKVVVLSFWATWCAPCMKLIPHEKELAIRHKNEPFAIVGVNGDSDPQAIARAVEKHQISWRSFHDKRDGAATISDAWSALYPTVYVIDHKGIIRWRFTGAPDPETLAQMIDDLLKDVHVE
jgi:thiol-disulfide isomerase/thioredoxin